MKSQWERAQVAQEGDEGVVGWGCDIDGGDGALLLVGEGDVGMVWPTLAVRWFWRAPCEKRRRRSSGCWRRSSRRSWRVSELSEEGW
jgi:hypothetical protein